MRGLQPKKSADGVNKKQRKSKATADEASKTQVGGAKAQQSSISCAQLRKEQSGTVPADASVTSVSAVPASIVRRATGKRVRRKHNPNAWATSSPSVRTNVLCLGVSYPSVRHQLLAQEIDPRVLNYSDNGIDQTVELVQRNILTEMDGRDLVRCLAMEEANDTMAYCVSLENGARYDKRHLHANFNRQKFISQMKTTWGKVKFRQIILDYFWIPRGTWVMSHWSRSFFDTILPSFVTEGMIDFSSGAGGGEAESSRKVNSRLQADSTAGFGGGVVYLPFCLHCVKEVTAAIEVLSKYYAISFLYKSELSEHALWSATNSIDPNIMQRQFGKAIAQEEVYCTFKPQEAFQAAEDAHISKKEVIEVLRRIEDFEDVRMIKLSALRKFDPEYRGSTASGIVGVTKGGYVGLKDPSDVVRGFDHVGKKPSKAAAEASGRAAVSIPIPVPVTVSSPSVPVETKNAANSKKRKRDPSKTSKPTAEKKDKVRAKDPVKQPQAGKKTPWNTARWEENFAELLEYKRTHGDCLVKSNYKPNPKLVQWVYRQRHWFRMLEAGKKSQMTEERIRRLEEVGFVFTLHDRAPVVGRGGDGDGQDAAAAADATNKQSNVDGDNASYCHVKKKPASRKSKAKEQKADQSDTASATIDVTVVTPSAGTLKQKAKVGVRKSPRASSEGLGFVTPSPTTQVDPTVEASTIPDAKSTEPNTVVSQALSMSSPDSSSSAGSTLVRSNSSVSSCPSLKSSPDVSEDDVSEVESVTAPSALRTPTKNIKATQSSGSTKAAGAGSKRKRLEDATSSLERLPSGKPHVPPQQQPLNKRKLAKSVESVLATTGFGEQKISVPRRSPRKSNAAIGVSVASVAAAHQISAPRRSPRRPSQDPHASTVYPSMPISFPPGDVLAMVGVAESEPTPASSRAPRKMWQQRAQAAQAASDEKRKLQDKMIEEARIRVLKDLGRTDATSCSHGEDSAFI